MFPLLRLPCIFQREILKRGLNCARMYERKKKTKTTKRWPREKSNFERNSERMKKIPRLHRLENKIALF